MTPAYTLAVTVCDTRSSSADVRVQRHTEAGDYLPADAPTHRIANNLVLVVEIEGAPIWRMRFCQRVQALVVEHAPCAPVQIAAPSTGRPRFVLPFDFVPTRVRTYYSREGLAEHAEVPMLGLPDRGVCWIEGGPET